MGLFARLARNTLPSASTLHPTGLSRFANEPEPDAESQNLLVVASPSPPPTGPDHTEPAGGPEGHSAPALAEHSKRPHRESRPGDRPRPEGAPHTPEPLSEKTDYEEQRPTPEPKDDRLEVRGDPQRPAQRSMTRSASPAPGESDTPAAPERVRTEHQLTRPSAPEHPTAWRDPDLISPAGRKQENREGPTVPRRERPAPPEQETTVTVSIGRLEVRAPQRPTRPAPKPWSEGPVLTLAEYVRRRGEGSS